MGHLSIGQATALRNLILNDIGDNGKLFTVRFVKRTTGEERTLNGRLGVKKHLKGGESTTAHDQTLLTIYCPNEVDSRTGKKGCYRCISLDAVLEIKGNGLHFIVEG